MFLSRGDRDHGVAFQTHPGRQAFISSGSKEARSALESRRVSLGAHWVDSRESMTPDQGLNLGCLHWEHRVSAIGREVPIKEFVTEQSPMAVPEQDSFSPSCVLRLPFVCRKTLVKE